jgi:hypothetical protein
MGDVPVLGAALTLPGPLSLGREVGIVDEAARLLALLLVWWVVTNTLR